MTFAAAIKSAFNNYANFRGVASRSAYWYFFLFTALVGIVVSTLTSVIDSASHTTAAGNLSGLVSLALFLPGYAVRARRFHDAGWSGLWMLLELLPLVLVIAALPTIITNLGVFTPDVLNSFTNNTNYMPDQKVLDAVLAILASLVPALLAGIGYSIFSLVICLLPTKTAAQGNRHSKVAQAAVANPASDSQGW